MGFRVFGRNRRFGMLLGLQDSTTYAQRLLNIDRANLVAGWDQSETSGTVAADSSGNGLNATYAASITLNAAAFADGTPMPLYDANADVVTLPVATLDSPFDPTLGTLMIWLKVRAASVWTDGVSHFAIELGADASNRIFISKSATNNTLSLSYRAGGAAQTKNITYSATSLTAIHITWNKTSDRVRFYLNGAQDGADLGSMGVWSGALSNLWTAMGNFISSGGANYWDGYLKYAKLWKSELTAGQIAQTVPASFLV